MDKEMTKEQKMPNNSETPESLSPKEVRELLESGKFEIDEATKKASEKLWAIARLVLPPDSTSMAEELISERRKAASNE